MEKFITLKKKRRKRKHGFRSRMARRAGRKAVKRRVKKGRKRITV